MTATLTQRYIAAAIRSLPPTSQDDVRAELTGGLADRRPHGRVGLHQMRPGRQPQGLRQLHTRMARVAGLHVGRVILLRVGHPLRLMVPRHAHRAGRRESTC